MRPTWNHSKGRATIIVSVICVGLCSGLATVPSTHATYTSRGDVAIYGNSGFTRDNGVVGGSGTKQDPFLIEGLEISPYWCGICVTNTTAYFVIRNVYVHSGQLSDLGGHGIGLDDVSNARIENSVIQDDKSGIVIATSYRGSYSNVAVVGNAIYNGGIGVIVYSPASISNVTISNNTVSGGGSLGISLESVTKATVSGNVLGFSGIYVSGSSSQLESYTITPDNFVNGRPVIFRKGCEGLTFSGSSYGELVLASCRNVHVVGVNMTNSVLAIEFAQVDGGSIMDSYMLNTTQGMSIVNSANIVVSGNNLSSSAQAYGNMIDVTSSSTISVRNNTVSGGGIRLLNTNSSTVYGNTLSGNFGLQVSGSNIRIANNYLSDGGGIGLGNGYYTARNINITGNVVSGSRITIGGYSLFFVGNGILVSCDCYPVYGALDNITISRNNLSYGNIGIHLVGATNVTVTSNNISYNDKGGVTIETCSNPGCNLPPKTSIRVYHNNFIGNGGDQGSGYATWDNGYPSGGNHWSDYTGVDNCSGFYQNICPSPDGIGDTVRGVAGITADDYPLMNPYGPLDSAKPSWSTGAKLSFIDVSTTQVTLEWPPATDDTWVQSYRVFQDGRVVASVPGDTFSYRVSDLRPGARYNFTVDAGDAWANWSSEGLSSTVVMLSRPASTPPPGSGAAVNPLGLLQQYWYFIGGVAVCGSALSFFLAFRRRSNRRSGL